MMMSNSHPEAAVLIGRFQPFHRGHLQLLRRAFASAGTVLLLCGSSNTPRTLKNPFTYEERDAMIRAVLTPKENTRLITAPIDDYPYDDAAWTLGVQTAAIAALQEAGISRNASVALIGHKKDGSSYYLDLFPNWGWIETENFDDISATPIRETYWQLKPNEKLPSEHLPSAVYTWLETFRSTEDYARLQTEQQAIDADKALWADSPYPPIFVTVDALVEHRNAVLLIERGNHPGKGLLAMPGGFIDAKENLFTSCLRELAEETGLPANAGAWRGLLQAEKCYSAVGRSPRGRVITHVYHFRIPDDIARPPVAGLDDAAKAMWLPLSQLDARQFHDDHYHIIRELTGK